MVGILVQIKGASCVAFMGIKSGKVVSSTLIIAKIKLQRFGSAAFIKVMATERRMGWVSSKYLSSLSMRNKGEKKKERKRERKKERKKRKEKKQQSPGDQMRLGLGGLVNGVFILPYTNLFLSI